MPTEGAVDLHNIPAARTKMRKLITKMQANLPAIAGVTSQDHSAPGPRGNPAVRATDLTHLPPAYIPVGTLDLFIDENIEYAQRLIQAGVPTELHVYPGAIHGFDAFAPSAAVSKQFKAERDQALKRALHHK
jgi:acetyl esterase/lipase